MGVVTGFLPNSNVGNRAPTHNGKIVGGEGVLVGLVVTGKIDVESNGPGNSAVGRWFHHRVIGLLFKLRWRVVRYVGAE